MATWNGTAGQAGTTGTSSVVVLLSILIFSSSCFYYLCFFASYNNRQGGAGPSGTGRDRHRRGQQSGTERGTGRREEVGESRKAG